MVYVFEDGREAVRCSRQDVLGLAKMRRRGLAMCIPLDRGESRRHRPPKKLANCAASRAARTRAAALDALLAETGCHRRAARFVGNDINDLPCLTRAGLPIIVHDAHPDVLAYALYRTTAPGGHGAVREVCDLFERGARMSDPLCDVKKPRGHRDRRARPEAGGK